MTSYVKVRDDTLCYYFDCVHISLHISTEATHWVMIHIVGNLVMKFCVICNFHLLLPSAFLFSKVILLGESGVGKSNLLLYYTHKMFHLEAQPTVGTDFYSEIIEVDSKKIKAYIWDTGVYTLSMHHHSFGTCFFSFSSISQLLPLFSPPGTPPLSGTVVCCRAANVDTTAVQC